MALTNQDKTFLMKLKSQGVSKEDAIKRLAAVKQGMTQQAQAVEAPEKPKGVPFADKVTGAIAGIGAGGVEKGGQLVGGALELLGKGASIVTPGKEDVVGGAIEKAGSFLKETGQDFAQDIRGQVKRDLGDDAESGFDVGEKVGGGAVVLGTAASGAAAGRAAGSAGAAKAGVGARALPFAGESIGGTIGASEASTGELPGKGELAAGGAIDLGLSLITGKFKPAVRAIDDALKKISPETGLKKAEGEAVRAGLDAPELNLIKELPDDLRPMANDLIDQARKRSERVVSGGKRVDGAMDVVAGDVKTFQSEVGQLLKETGEKIGVEAKNLKQAPKLNTQNTLASLKGALEDLNIKFNNDGVLTKNSFADSDIQGLKEDQKLIMEMYDFLDDAEGKNPRDVLAKVRNLSNKLFAGRGEITASKNPANVVRASLRSEIDKLPGSYGELARKYSDLLDAESQLMGTVRADAENAAAFLRRLFGRASGKAETTVELIQNIADTYGIESGKNLVTKSALAEAIDVASGNVPRQGLSGQVSEAIQDAFVRKGIKGATLERVLSFIENKIAPTPEKMVAFEQLIGATDDPIARPNIAKAFTLLNTMLSDIPDIPSEFIVGLRGMFQE